MSANQVAVLETKPSLVRRVAERYGVDPDKMLATLKATAFRGAGEITNEQMMALLIVADAHGLNPWLRELYAFPSRNGIVPIVGVDGWARIINSRPEFNGMSFTQDDKQCTCTMYRKDREHPVVVTEYHDECVRNTEPWKTHPKRMLRHKSMIQAARLAFSLTGVYDPDEAEAIIQAEEIDVTPVKLSPKRIKELAEGMLAAVQAKDRAALSAIYDPLTNDERMALWPHMRSYERSGIKALLSNKALPDDVDIDAWAVTALNGAKDGVDLLAAWTATQDAYAEKDLQVSADVEVVYLDRKQLLGVPGDN